MELTTISHTPGGGPVAAAALWQITGAVGEPPLRLYQRTFYLRLPTGGAEHVVVDAGATALAGAFLPFEYDAVTAAAPLRAGLQSGGGGVLVDLEEPRRVASIELAAAAFGAGAHTLQLYRRDGARLAEEPTVTRALSATSRSATLGADEFVDLRFALRLDGAPAPLAPGRVAALRLLSLPAAPRLGLAAPDSPDPPLVFWPVPGAPSAQVDAGVALAETLQRHLDRVLAEAREQLAAGAITALPAFIDIALVVQSDGPCRLDLDSLRVSYRLAQESFADGAPKQVLRFGDRVGAQQALLRLPAGAAVASAGLRVVESLRGGQPVQPGAGGGAAGPEPEPDQTSGVYLEGERWAAQLFTPPQALRAVGCALAVLALSAPAELSVELQEDWRGLPSGRRLAAARLTLREAGRPAWVRLPFAEPAIIPAQPHWLLVQAARGQALCLLDTATTPARLLERDERGGWRELRVYGGLALLQRLYAPPPAAAAVSPAAGAPPSPYTLAVGGQEVPGQPGPDDSRTFDIAAALQAFLAAAPAGPAEVPLTFSAAAPGLLTVYPPRVEYEI